MLKNEGFFLLFKKLFKAQVVEAFDVNPSFLSYLLLPHYGKFHGFQAGGTKLDRFMHKNQHTQRN